MRIRAVTVATLLGALLAGGGCSSAPPTSTAAATSRVAASSILATPSGGPSVPPFAGTPDEYLAALFDCLRAGGWSVTRSSTGGYSVSVASGQFEAFNAARNACAASLGAEPTIAPFTEADIRARYDYLLKMRDCLMALGYTISEPPSIEEFIDTYDTGPWSPYDDVAEQSGPGGWDEANRACPQIPNQ